jgi:hypothetical protein
MPAGAFKLLAGELRSFEVVCGSGRIKTCAFCPTCGTRLYHRSEARISVKAGTLDDTSSLRPDAHYWTARKQPWATIPAGVPSFPEDG